MSLFKKLKEAYAEGRNRSDEERRVVAKFRYKPSAGIESLQDTASERVRTARGLENKGILEKLFFYAGEFAPYPTKLK